MTDLGLLLGHGNSFATDINNAGHVVGTLQVGPERMSFVWRDNKMTVHRGGHGLRIVNAITDREQVVGAEGQQKFQAATMLSSAAPVVTKEGIDLVYLIALVIVLSLATVIVRKRYSGISLRHEMV